MFADLSAGDLAALRKLSSTGRRSLRGREDVIHEGDRQSRLFLLLHGWACRYKTLQDGRRQVVSVALPGDMCEPHVHVLPRVDCSLGAITPVVLAELDPKWVDEICAGSPAIARALWFDSLATLSVQREWTVNMGQRSAHERIGHLLLELYFRQRALGMTDGLTCPMPLTQADIADATGMTSVHVNRSMQILRQDGLLDVRSKKLKIRDMRKLMLVSLFDPAYLLAGPEIDFMSGLDEPSAVSTFPEARP